MSPLLSTVIVLQVASSSPDGVPHDSVVAWEQAALTVWVASSDEGASEVALALLLRALRGRPIPPALQAWELAEARRVFERGEAPFSRTTGPIAITLPEATVEGLRAKWGQTTRWHDRIPLSLGPDGPVVLDVDGDDLLLQPGDVLRTIGGKEMTGLSDIDSYSAFGAITVLRAGEPVQLPSVLRPVDVRIDDYPPPMGPTCGPCCHGHCEDDVPPIAVPVPVPE